MICTVLPDCFLPNTTTCVRPICQSHRRQIFASYRSGGLCETKPCAYVVFSHILYRTLFHSSVHALLIDIRITDFHLSLFDVPGVFVEFAIKRRS